MPRLGRLLRVFEDARAACGSDGLSPRLRIQLAENRRHPQRPELALLLLGDVRGMRDRPDARPHVQGAEDGLQAVHARHPDVDQEGVDVPRLQDAEGLGAVDVMGILPHMHKRGRHMEVSFGVGDRSMCGADVDRWNFDWQQAYFLSEPLPVTMEDRLQVSCTWDTRAETQPVVPGFGTANEMCLVGLYLVEAA